MRKLIVLGPGCPRCDRLADATRRAAERIGLEYELEKVKEIMEFPKYGVMMTPALVVDGEVKVQGRIPSLDELEKMLR